MVIAMEGWMVLTVGEVMVKLARRGLHEKIVFRMITVADIRGVAPYLRDDDLPRVLQELGIGIEEAYSEDEIRYVIEAINSNGRLSRRYEQIGD
jgi:hypothetical protein